VESVDPVVAGSGPGNLTYTITLKNMGLTNATGVAVSEVLTIPAGVTVDSMIGSSGTSVVMNTATNYTWNVGSFGAGNTATLTAVLTVTASAMTGTNSICDTATVTASNEVRVNTGDDAATECTSVLAQADLEITSKTDAPDPACVDGTIAYTVGLRNNGPGPGLNTRMIDSVPANTTFVSAAATSGTGCASSLPAVGGTGAVMFSKASVANGETATFQIVVKVNTGTLHGTAITNSATASSDLVDPVPGNNGKTATTTVDPIAPVITCPANMVATAVSPGSSTVIVNYPPPAASDNCPGVATVCVPPSGAAFPLGATTVTCTATDGAGNSATCAFTVTTFDLCVADDGNPGAVVLVNTATGEYRFCCGGTMYVGTGAVTTKGNLITVQENTGPRRVLIKVDKGPKSGTASFASPPGITLCQIRDTNITNNSCACQ
jgi:uncharacterized repeat protein (TIGR01451 family)